MCGFALNNREKGEVILDCRFCDWGFEPSGSQSEIRNPKSPIFQHRIPGSSYDERITHRFERERKSRMLLRTCRAIRGSSVLAVLRRRLLIGANDRSGHRQGVGKRREDAVGGLPPGWQGHSGWNDPGYRGGRNPEWIVMTLKDPASPQSNGAMRIMSAARSRLRSLWKERWREGRHLHRNVHQAETGTHKQYPGPDLFQNLYDDPDRNLKEYPELKIDHQPPGKTDYVFDLKIAGREAVAAGPNAVTHFRISQIPRQIPGTANSPIGGRATCPHGMPLLSLSKPASG